MDNFADIITAMGVAHGPVAQRLLASGFKVNALRTATVLRKDEWVLYDREVVDVARTRLGAVGDLMSRGLVLPITNAMGTTVVQWEQGSDMTAAEISMDGVTPGRGDRQTFTLNNLPVPIIHKDFNINLRVLEASRRGGQPLDTSQAGVATRLVSERIETMLFNGASLTHANGTIYGYTNHPNRNTGTSLDWTDAVNNTGEEIVQDVLAMIAALQGDNMYGPYGLYVSVAQYNRLLDDYKAASDRTLLERILAIPQIAFVRPTSDLSSKAHVMVQLTKDVVDMVVGQQPIPVMWDSEGGFQVNFKVLAIMVPRIKSDIDGRCGVAHFS